MLYALLFLFSGGVFSQDLSSLAVFVFEVSDNSALKAEDGEALTRRCIDEIISWGALIMLDESQAENADYVIRGTLSQTRNRITLSAETFNGKTEQSLASVKTEASSMEELYEKLFDFCINITQPIPFPNYLVGIWETSIPVEGSPLLCRLEFKSDRTVIIQRYDTYEYHSASVLKYEGYGRGNYTYFSRIQQGSTVNALLGISFTLEDALPAYTSFSGSRMSLVFDEGRTSFILSGAGLPCGENNGGTSVYPQKNMFYTHFVKKD